MKNDTNNINVAKILKSMLAKPKFNEELFRKKNGLLTVHRKKDK